MVKIDSELFHVAINITQTRNAQIQALNVRLGYSRVHEVYGEQDRQRKEEKLNKKNRS